MFEDSVLKIGFWMNGFFFVLVILFNGLTFILARCFIINRVRHEPKLASKNFCSNLRLRDRVMFELKFSRVCVWQFRSELSEFYEQLEIK